LEDQFLRKLLLQSARTAKVAAMRKNLKWPRLALLLLAFVFPASAQEWTRFRGPNGTGISLAKSIPTHWMDDDFNWKVALPGSGHSSPVLWGGKIFLLSGDEKSGQRFALCLSTNDGRILWQRDFEFTPFQKHEHNSFASSTPAVDSERVYLVWNEPDHYRLTALDHNGKTVWQRDFGPFISQHGCGTSPIVFKDRVILANDQDDKQFVPGAKQSGESFIVAVDAKTGKTIWQTPRRSVVVAYSTPCVYETKNGQPALIFNTQAHGISAIDPDTGNVLWEYAKAFEKRSVSSPVIASGLIIGSCGSGGGGNYAVAVRPGDPTRNKKPELAYEIRKSAPYVPTGIALGELLFLWSDGGIVSCVDAPSGRINWQERVAGDFFGSPVCVDGRLFCVSTSGDVVVIKASADFQVLARNPLNELTHSTPAVAGGRMYIRTSSHLISIGGRKGFSARN
jgi:outer membrane protein assembly factor BamB